MLQSVLVTPPTEVLGEQSDFLSVSPPPGVLSGTAPAVPRAEASKIEIRAATTDEEPPTSKRCGFERPDELEMYRCKRLNSAIHFRPDWRWLRAWLLAEGLDRALFGTDDDLVQQVVEYLRVGHFTTVSKESFTANLAEACDLFRSNSLSTELQARLLAKENSAAIAEQMGLRLPVIDLYHDLFYAIRPHIGCATIILHRAFSPSFHRYRHIPGFSDLLKLAAYRGGVPVLEELLWYQRTPRPSVPRNLTFLPAEDLAHLERWYSMHLFVVTHRTAPRNERECLQYAAITMRHRD